MADDDDTREVHVNGTSPAPEPPVTVDTSIKDGNTTVNYDSHGGKGAATAVEHMEITAESTKHRRQGTDPEAQEMVISSLKSQIQDLFSQVNELNNKLVKSYDRVSDLEDDIHVASANLRQSSIRISHLELERTQHLAALNTGLLVEKAHVTAELNRLMEKATEEAAQRGQAESARVAIEKDLDDLSASLFGQANTMVAEARYAQHLSERKVEDAERALRDAEEMVGLMQVQMQTMQEDKDQAQQQMTEMQAVMGKGKYREREPRSADLVRQVKLLSSHVPYQEFLLFVAHLRSLHTTSPIPPAMTTLLPLPFLARLTTEEAEPTVRLDLAPALNWLSRRSILSAIHSGQLTVEPVPVSALFSETAIYSSPTTIVGVNPSNDSVSCALCGAVIIAATEHRRRPPSLTSISGVRSSFSGSFFKKTSTITSSRPPSPTSAVTPLQVSTSSSHNGMSQPPHQIYIFRVASAPSTTSSISSALPLPSIAKSLSQGASPSPGASFSGNASPAVSSSPNNQPMTIYPLCTSGWCLGRLRSTCQLWSFIRTGIVDRIWEEEVPVVPVTPTSTTPASGAASSPSSSSATPDKPPVPPRRRGLWGGIASAFGDRASSWTGESAEKKAAAASSTPATPVTPPPLPPRKDARRMPPPPNLAKEASLLEPEPEPEVTTVVHPSTPPTRSSGPPLPPRSGKRSPTSVPNGDSREHAEGAVPTESAPSSPVRVVFDMTHPQSPMRLKEKALPSESTIQEGTEPLVTYNGPSVPPALTPIAGNSEAAGPNGAAVKVSEIPLPESRPTSPEALGTPVRVASPSIAGMIANGVGSTPPPLPRRAAARRPVPPPPGSAISASVSGDVGSRPGTPMKKMEDRAVVEGKTEKVGQDTVEGKETVLEDHKESPQPPEQKAVESESEDEFVDAVGGITSPDSLSTPAVEVSSDPIVDVPDKITVANPGSEPKSAEETPGRRQSIDTLKEVPKPLEACEKPAEAPPLTVAPEDLEPSLATADTALGGIEKYGDSPVDDSDANALEDGRDSKEVYVGDTTWEERTWKEVVRLKEDMFWARVGGWRP